MLLSFSSCIEDDRFGLSPFKEIRNFELVGQAVVSVINSEEATVVIPMRENSELVNIAPANIEISNLASISHQLLKYKIFPIL